LSGPFVEKEINASSAPVSALSKVTNNKEQRSEKQNFFFILFILPFFDDSFLELF
jgi:hypothetical protein